MHEAHVTPHEPLLPSQPGQHPPLAPSAPTLILVGNPNVGKSVIFQLLTGRYATVSNYPGTTVMVSQGTTTLAGTTYTVLDTPGLNSLQATSEDEAVARDVVLGDAATVLQVGDAKNLERALLLTLELVEAEVPLILNLNMIDEARERRVTVDTERLAALLGVPVIPTIAVQRHGIDRLRKALPLAQRATAAVRYPEAIEGAAHRIEQLLPSEIRGRRALALLWLAGDQVVIEQMTWRLDPAIVQVITELTDRTRAQCASPLGLVITQARAREARRVAALVLRTEPAVPLTRFARLGDLAMHPFWGVVILAGVLWGMYVLVGDVAAQRGVGFLEEVVFGRYLVPAARWVVQGLVPWAWGQALLIGDYGLLTMALPYAFAIILPIVSMFFLCFGLLEDIGYLPRLSVMANRGCRVLGLNGKAVLPLVLGLGCDTMATMTTRILEGKRDRVLVTLLLALGVPCSAQLGVIFAMLVGHPPLALMIWASVLLAVILIVGRTAAWVLPGEPSPFLYEIPPLRRPKLSNVLIKTLGRVEWYIKEAVPLFFLGTLVLFVLDASGVLHTLEQWATPVVVGWLGLPAKATGAFLIGFLRRDFGAAGLFAMQRAGELTGIQTLVSLVTITLFVPCIAQYFMMIKERGWKMASAMAVFVFGAALLTGGILFRALTFLQVRV